MRGLLPGARSAGLTLGIVLVSGLEIGSYSLLPPGGEANPIVVSLGALAVPLKAGVALALVAYARSVIRYGRLVGAVAVAVWGFGAWTNLLTIEGGRNMDIDPGTARQILEGVLTLAGATVTATIVAGIIEAIKRLPGLGSIIDAGREYVLALGLWAILIVYAVLALQLPTDPVALFGYFLAWLGGAKLSGAAYDVAHTKSLSG